MVNLLDIYGEKLEYAYEGVLKVIQEAMRQEKDNVSAAARRLGVSRQRLHGIVHEHQPVREDMALRLERLFGSSAEMWLGMQSAHDLWHHRRRMAAELADIHPQPDNHAAG